MKIHAGKNVVQFYKQHSVSTLAVVLTCGVASAFSGWNWKPEQRPSFAKIRMKLDEISHDPVPLRVEPKKPPTLPNKKSR